MLRVSRNFSAVSRRFGLRFTSSESPTKYTKLQLNNMDLEDWAVAFKRETIDLADVDSGSLSYEQSAERMRSLVRSSVLRHDDIVKKPERFFLAHRLLAFHAPKLGPGFWIRFTVHYNLCMGSVVSLGNKEQVALLAEYQDEGKLGCFSLTEKFAGVNSGLIVGTTAEWDPVGQEFVLNTPNEGAAKNWISQGLVADVTTVVAQLIVDGKSRGPHAFLMNMREGGKLADGVSVQDMGRKTVGNDLDNAAVFFDQVRLPKSSLLSRYADITEEGYTQTEVDRPVFHMIGQRLFTGRVAVAQAALQFSRGLFSMAKEYTDSKMCWSPGGDVPLSSIPQLRALYRESREDFDVLDAFCAACEKELVGYLKTERLPPVKLVEAIAVAKVRTVERCITLTNRLKNELGSYALMANTGFDQTDFLQCCKFAEGDSRILMQKMARDRMKEFLNSDLADITFFNNQWNLVTQACFRLNAKIKEHPDKQVGWDENYEDVYELAELYMDKVIKKYVVAKEEASNSVLVSKH